MNRFFSAVAVCAALFVPGISIAETGLTELFQREQSSLNRMPGRHLKSLLTVSQPKNISKPTTMNYSIGWLDAEPTATGDAQWRCLSEALYFEARGETVKGQFAVAEVILNRVKSSRFPGTICDVIQQGTGRKYQCQFTYTCDGRKEVIAEPKAFERVSKVARATMDSGGNGLTIGATHYHTTSVRPSWSRSFAQTARIGVHVFYRDKQRTASNE